MGRYADEGGQLILFHSFISGAVLPTGSRRTGHESTMKYEGGQRSYRIIEDGSRVSLIRSETQTQDPCHLFNDNRKNGSKIKNKFVTFDEHLVFQPTSGSPANPVALQPTRGSPANQVALQPTGGSPANQRLFSQPRGSSANHEALQPTPRLFSQPRGSSANLGGFLAEQFQHLRMSLIGTNDGT